MSSKNKYINYESCSLADDLVERYAKHGVRIKITDWQIERGGFRFTVKLKGGTREDQVRTRAPDVQLDLKLPLLRVVKHDLTLYLVTSLKEPDYDRLPKILNGKLYQKALDRLWLPYVVGYDSFGELVILDVDDLPHLLMGGSTGSGKSVGLQALVLSIASGGSADDVNLILIDLGATSLKSLEGLPHLSCPVIQDRSTVLYALEVLVTEMERRIKLEFEDPDGYDQLPRLVLVIDEFQALFLGAEKAEGKRLRDMLSILLQRGRHAKIHLVLAAQNPTFQYMKVDLSNITARVAFKCAKQNFSETILGEGGAEKLLGSGDMLIKAPGVDGAQRLRGVYIKPGEVGEIIQQIRGDPWYFGRRDQRFVIPEHDLVPKDVTDNCGPAHCLPCTPVAPKPSGEKRLLADMVLWAMGKNSISINVVQREFHLGWNKASSMVEALEAMGIVEHPDSKRPRRIVPTAFDDIPDDMLRFLAQNGVTSEDVVRVLTAKSGPPLVIGGEENE